MDLASEMEAGSTGEGSSTAFLVIEIRFYNCAHSSSWLLQSLSMVENSAVQLNSSHDDTDLATSLHATPTFDPLNI